MDETNRVELARVAAFREYIHMLPSDLNFSTWLSVMAELQEVAYGSYYDDFDAQTKADSMMMNLLAAHSEVTEMGDEMGWKPWVAKRGWINRASVINEAVDVMHFLANLLKHANCTGEELSTAYRRKMLKNLDRQLEGYDGIGDKCPSCHRDLTEILSENRYRVLTIDNVRVAYCSRECAHADA